MRYAVQGDRVRIVTMIQIEIGIAIEIEKKWDVDMQTGKPGTVYRPFVHP
ncbi:hypothetical protein DSCOOX_65680 [Desulfosarcina ovata subsp. ovata]|uniref:Uncharacterized protein n=1 Tax=Desulfosarcina ovata subsp. ovata TaxID=2752305 RepID=A0A5K8AL84_9BACT|nr:hypothetical protein DSCOOX_65680 [Desulfosarcina ovata subsp. ovata]